MARVASYKTRQALLSVGTSLDPSITEKLELFTEDGLPVDVGKDRTRARWRGTWTELPTAPYETNDFVMDNDKLWILNDADVNETNVHPSDSTTGAWVLMTVSGMQFQGDWVPGEYKNQAVVINDGKLWVANQDIIDIPFDYVGGNWDDATGGSPQAPIVAVHTDAQVGDLLIWAGVKFGYGSYSKPNEVGWTKIMEQPLQSGSFPAGTFAIYGKIAEEADLGSTKTSVAVTEYAVAQLLVYRGAIVPVEAEVDYFLVEQHSTPAAIAAAGDPAETGSADKVLRFWATVAQNFAMDSGNNPSWGVGADAQDKFLVDSHELLGIGSYWAEPGDSALPSYTWSSGEHKYTGRATVRLPSPSGFNLDQWDQVAIVEVPPLDPDIMVWAGVWNEDAPTYPQGNVVWHDDALWFAPEDMPMGQEPGVSLDSFLFTKMGIDIYASHRIASTDPVELEVDADDIPSTFTNPKKCHPIILDQTSGDHTVTIYNDHSANMRVDKRDSAGNQAGGATLVAPGGNAAFPSGGSVSSGQDYFLFVYFEDGSLGPFRAKVDSAANLLSPPGADWEELIAAGSSLPPGGAAGELLAKIDATDGNVEWIPAPEGGGGGGGSAGSVDIEGWNVVGAAGQPAFTNSWASHSAGYAPKFRKRPDGVVELTGLLISGNNGQAAFTLPVGYRPDAAGADGYQFTAMAAAAGSGAATPCRLDVNPDGTVVPQIAGSSIVWLSLVAIRFPTNQTDFPAGDVGGGASDPGLILDEKFDTDMSAFSAISNITVENGYARRTANGSAAAFDYTAIPLRNVLVVAEISMIGAAGNPVLNMYVRKTGSQLLQTLCHDTNFHLYKTGGTLITWSGHGGFTADGRKYWMQIAAHGPFLEGHFFTRHPKSRPVNPAVNLDADLSGDGAQYTGSNPDKVGNIGTLGFELGTNVRLHRLQIYDLDQSNMWE